MVFHMAKTTLNIDDNIMKALKAEAARRGTTMSALVEAGLRMVLEEQPPAASLPALPSWSGGRELIDISNREVVAAAFDQKLDQRDG